MAEASLAELASRHGIELAYHDIWGNLHAAPDATLRALLASMHVDASSPGEVEAAIAQHERERRASTLQPAYVVRQTALADGVRIQLRSALAERPLTWRVAEETGRGFSGGFTPHLLREAERFELDGEMRHAVLLPLPPSLAPGYHRLAIFEGTEPLAETSLIVAPDHCYQPEAIADGGRVWGGALQLYSLRSERNWGIGDYTDLRTCIEQWANHGASIMGVNPLHALFLHQPEHASPYSPSSRMFFNVLYLDVEAIEDFREATAARETARTPEFVAQLKRLRETEFVDYAGVAAVKRPLLEQLYAHFYAQHMRHNSARAVAFRAFCAERGLALRRHALFEAIQEHLQQRNSRTWGWQEWPEYYRDPGSPEVAQFAIDHAQRVGFFEYLQWQANLQLTAIEERCFELELGIGLYADLAISVDRGGAEAWANQELYALGASIGAPPDDFNLPGQDWGLPPFVPERLHGSAYAPLIATLRANMGRAGALRIDHVMGLARMFWIPAGMRPAQGTYVRYPFADMLGIVALESHRNHCLVIGEDLGTVPDEVRAALQNAQVLSYRLLIFERDGAGRFRPPPAYPRHALAACSTHDLPALAGYWRGQDLLVRDALGLFPDSDQRDARVLSRTRERAELLLALEREGLLPAGVSLDSAAMPEATPELILALHYYLARSPAAVMVAQFEDVTGVLDQANLPGTIDQYPNWRRKLPLPLERWNEDARFTRLAAALSSVRARPQAARIRVVRRRVGVGIPRATYRLQLHREFTFRDAAALVPYLAALGISHVYCSPYLRARSGSVHGYDIIDHQTLNPEIGSRADFDAFVATLVHHGMGQMADLVPNHMGVLGADNAWWLDVLENGPASVYADFFDIDWQPSSPDLAERVLVPVLGDHYGSVLARGELGLQFEPADGSFSVRYNEHRFPIDPLHYAHIIERALTGSARIDLANAALSELKSLISAFSCLPARNERAPERITERSAGKEAHKRRLAALATEHDGVAAAMAAAARSFHGQPGDSASFDAMHELLEAQAYRLSYWRVASDEINYRRFFDVNDLAALRTENEAVFEATHRLLLELVQSGAVDALRIDHPDGLFDPAAYFRRLQDHGRELGGPDSANAPGPALKTLYVVIEKIIAPFENMPESWAVHGTTGYRFANVVNGLFVDSGAQARLTRTYQAFTGVESSFEEIATRAKLVILRAALASELTVLANRLARIARANRDTRDYTLNTLRQALAEVIAAFPVYRTYIAEAISDTDRRYIEWAVARAKRHSRAADTSIFDFIKSVLLCEPATAQPSRLATSMRSFARKFQQLTAPVTAKGVEDTAFYIYNRLISLNDVGGDPATFGYSVSAFHGASADRAARWPHTMLATSTHDNKRSEDVRARIDALSELVPAWRLQLRRWSRMNRSKKREVDGAPAPSRNDEYMLYQTLIGTFPTAARGDNEITAYRERIERYMLKAVREAKVNTSWVNPNAEYEAAVAHFVRALLAPPERNLFLDDFRTAMAPLAWLGMLNSLSMMLVKYTSPGVPDCYQGNEILDFSLADPDNRRPVDYARRRELLSELAALTQQPGDLPGRVRALFATAEDGRAKLYLIWRLLALRRARPDTFLHGGYTPLQTAGTGAAHVVAYARRHAQHGVIAIAGRMYSQLGVQSGMLPCNEELWGDTRVEIPFLTDNTQLRHVLTGCVYTSNAGTIRMADVFADFPGAVLEYTHAAIDSS